MESAEWQDQGVQLGGWECIIVESIRKSIAQTTKDHAEARVFLRTAPGPLWPLPKELVHHLVVLGPTEGPILGPSLGLGVRRSVISASCPGGLYVCSHLTTSALC